MNGKYIKSLTAILLTGLLLMGCWDSGNIEQQNNVSLVIVDFQEERYRFYIEVANVIGENAESNKGGATYSVLKSSGDTLIGARDELNRRCDYPIFLGATRAVVFTQRMTEVGIEEYINRLRSEIDYRKSVPLLTTPTDPITLITDQPENDRSVGDALEHTLENQYKEGQSFIVGVGDVLQVLALENVGFLIPQMSVEEEEHTLTGYSIFKEAKNIGTIPVEERKGVLYFLGNKPRFYYDLFDEKNHFIISILLDKKGIIPKFENEQVTFDIEMSFTCEIQYMGKFTTITKEQQNKLSEKVTKMLENEIINTLKDSQETYRCDYLGFYKYFSSHYLNEFKKMNWEEKYAQAEMKVSVNAKVISGKSYEFIKE